ncbi:polysaccharide deacetylase family protein [Cohnella kolymensis]|uniref:polysaccharide deacetylase family protein n=1 Tax=Cohnella kolymensis TaxID=1590652 RepID=UPI00069727E7|nr:polysaccharide deacetylase family protein [Cohnella kolymensis]
MELILWMIFYFWTFYAFLPALISRIFGFRVFLRGKTEREIALTFDDGPDPIYTPQLLDLLKKEGAKATFFVVGESAERYPEIIARIHDEGHIIGIHNYVHHTNWFMRPRTVKRQIHRTSDIIKRITGTRPMYYRPPWGIVNVFDYANLGYLQIVLWTSMFSDWRIKIGADKLYKRMRRHLRPGEVLLLHDCGTTFGADRDAPAHTITALERILADGRNLGYRFVGIDEMITLTEQRGQQQKAGKSVVRRSAVKTHPSDGEQGTSITPLKKVLVSGWMLWEKLFHVMFRLRPLGDGKSFNYRVRRYAGPPLDLRGDTTLHSGDYVMELHFENQMLFDMGRNSRSSLHTGIKLIREVERALPHLARELSTAPHGDQVKGLYGVSMIHRGSESLGFETFDLPRGLFSWMTNFYLKVLMRVIHPEGNERVRHQGEKLSPRMLLMPRDILLSWAESKVRLKPNRTAKKEAETKAAAPAKEQESPPFEDTRSINLSK